MKVFVIFWASLAFLAYVEVGYPMLLWLLSLFRSHRPPAGDTEPTVTVLIAAYNEDQVIRAKLENTLALDYPRDKLQIIVASDCSTDRTDQIVQQFAEAGVQLCRIPERRGKVAALRATESLITGDVVVFSDADSMYQRDVLRKFVRHFDAPKVGAVSGHEIRVPAGPSGRGKGEGLYCRLDNLIKELEGKVGSQIMVNGGCFAVRRELLPQVPDHLPHDGVVPYTLALQGYRTAYEPEAISIETYSLDSKEDWQRRIRTVLQSVNVFMAYKSVLNPFRAGFYAIQILSHRVFRYMVFPALVVALIANALIVARSPLYVVLLAIQVTCYTLASSGMILDRVDRRPAVFYFPFYFLLLHAAAFCAAVLALSGREMTTWRPTRRETASREAKP